MRYYYVWVCGSKGTVIHAETLVGLREDAEDYVLEGYRLPRRGKDIDRRSWVQYQGRQREVVAVEEGGPANVPIATP